MKDYQEIICGYRMAPTTMTGDIECHSAIDKISRRHSASRLPRQSPLVCIASVAVDSKPFSTNISSVCQTRSFHWLMSVSGVFIHSQPSATFFSCAASLLIDSSRYDCYHGIMGAVGLYVSDCANDSPHKNYILDSKIMFVVAVSILDWIVSISIVRMWLEIRS